MNRMSKSILVIDTDKTKDFNELEKNDVVEYENSLYIIESIYLGDYGHPFARLKSLLNSNFHYAENSRLLKYKGTLQDTTELLEALEIFANSAYFFEGSVLEAYNKLKQALGSDEE
jgi:hypothetical protein